MRALVENLVAIPAGLLPKRWWGRFPSLQIERFAGRSGFATMMVGLALGVPWFLSYAEDLGMRVSVSRIAENPDPTPAAFPALAPFLFVTTARGMLSFYLVVSGMIRAVAAYVDDPHGDPVLSLVVAGAARVRTRTREVARAADRARREGPQAPDRLYPGEWAGLPQADYVVVASRRKPGWEAGVFVITSDKWYRLGAPFDLDTSAGLRTIYPLAALDTPEVLRKGVRYELPPLSRGRGARS